MILRSLNESGIRAFSEYLRALRGGERRPVPAQLLTGSDWSVPLHAEVDVEDRCFDDALAAAVYLNRVLAPLSGEDLQATGVWTWLALFYFEQLCPADRNGIRKVKADERYVLSSNRRRRYRHLLEGPYRIVRLHGKHARVMLRHPLHIHSDLSEQLTSRQEIATSRALIEAANILYYDAERNRPKPGVTDRRRAGTVRRLITVFQQLDRTYDIYSLSGERFMELLPQEFHGWLRDSADL